MQGLGPVGRGGFDEKKHLGRESKQGKAEKGWIWEETDQGITSYVCGDCLKSEKKEIRGKRLLKHIMMYPSGEATSDRNITKKSS